MNKLFSQSLLLYQPLNPFFDLLLADDQSQQPKENAVQEQDSSQTQSNITTSC